MQQDDATYMTTLKEHFEIIMRRFDAQDDLLHQIVAERIGSKGSALARVAALRDRNMFTDKELQASKLASGTSGATLDAETDQHDQGTASTTPLNPNKQGLLSSWSMSGVFGGLSMMSRKPNMFKSHSKEDMEAKHDALSAHTSHVRQVYSKKDMIRVELAGRKSCSALLREIVQHPLFDIFFATVVTTNAVFVGLDVEMGIQDPTSRPIGMDIAQYTFTALFTLELGLRFAVGGLCGMMFSEDCMWTVLDIVVVASSIWEIVLRIIFTIQAQDSGDTSISGLSSLKAFRIIRLTRILKTAQLVRIFRFVMALRKIVQSVLHTLKHLLWAMLLLLLIVYVFAVLFVQAVNDYVMDNQYLPEREMAASKIYFDSLIETMLTLFMSIAGGVSWEEPISTLKEISGWWTFLYLFYIAFTYFAVLNVVTAVFCQSAIESAQNDHANVVQNMLDNKESHLQKLRELFSKLGDESSGAITYGVFEEKIQSPAVRDYFETLGLDVWDPWAFFKLLDADGGGSVEIEEFFLGCLRFSGQARAMDVGKIIQDQSWMMKNQGRFQSYMEVELGKLREDMASFMATGPGPPVSTAMI